MNLTCKIIEKKGEKVLVEIESQIIALPLECFPNGVKSGNKFNAFFWDNGNEINNKKIAKEVLEEILNG